MFSLLVGLMMQAEMDFSLNWMGKAEEYGSKEYLFSGDSFHIPKYLNTELSQQSFNSYLYQKLKKDV